jgi:hypothetical protein
MATWLRKTFRLIISRHRHAPESEGLRLVHGSVCFWRLALRPALLDKARALAGHLVGPGDLDAEDRFAVAALVACHLKEHGDLERRLAAIPAG